MTEGPSDLDASAERLYAAAGRCINGWAFVDQALFDLFQAALGVDPVKASIVYYRSTSFNDHLILTDRLITATLAEDSPERADWAALRKRVEVLLPVRNRIAHHPTTVFSKATFRPDEGDGAGARQNEQWLAYVEEARKLVHLSERARFERITKSQIREADLAEHHNATVDLHADLVDFLGRAAGALGRPAPIPPWPEPPPSSGRSR